MTSIYWINSRPKETKLDKNLRFVVKWNKTWQKSHVFRWSEIGKISSLWGEKMKWSWTTLLDEMSSPRHKFAEELWYNKREGEGKREVYDSLWIE